MRLKLIPLILFLTACATPSTMMVNDKGQIVRCAASGYGIIGMTHADMLRNKCVDDMKAIGYRELSETPPAPQPVTAPAPAPPLPRPRFYMKTTKEDFQRDSLVCQDKAKRSAFTVLEQRNKVIQCMLEMGYQQAP